MFRVLRQEFQVGKRHVVIHANSGRGKGPTCAGAARSCLILTSYPFPRKPRGTKQTRGQTGQFLILNLIYAIYLKKYF